MASTAGRLVGRVALVTGGASGLGCGTAARFVRNGAKVVICDLPTQEEKGQDLANRLGHDNALFIPTDVTSEEDVKNALLITKNKFKKLDITVNCAGIGVSVLTYNPKKDNPLARFHTLVLFQRLVNTNLIGTFNVIRLCVDLMKDNEPDENGERGIIINTSSVSAFEGQRGQVAFAASTGGVNGMTLPVAKDLEDFGIRVNTIAPGYFDTPLLGNLPQKVKTFLESTVPNPPRLGRADEFAHLAESIIENPLINGEVIRIDGAIRMQP